MGETQSSDAPLSSSAHSSSEDLFGIVRSPRNRLAMGGPFSGPHSTPAPAKQREMAANLTEETKYHDISPFKCDETLVDTPRLKEARLGETDTAGIKNHFERQLAEAMETVWFAHAIQEMHLCRMAVAKPGHEEPPRHFARRDSLINVLLVLSLVGILGILVSISACLAPDTLFATISQRPSIGSSDNQHVSSFVFSAINQSSCGIPASNLVHVNQSRVFSDGIAGLYEHSLSVISNLQDEQAKSLASCEDRCNARNFKLNADFTKARGDWDSQVTAIRSAHQAEVAKLTLALKRLEKERAALYHLLIKSQDVAFPDIERVE